jgi:hypothetical protein
MRSPAALERFFQERCTTAVVPPELSLLLLQQVDGSIEGIGQLPLRICRDKHGLLEAHAGCGPAFIFTISGVLIPWYARHVLSVVQDQDVSVEAYSAHSTSLASCLDCFACITISSLSSRSHGHCFDCVATSTAHCSHFASNVLGCSVVPLVRVCQLVEHILDDFLGVSGRASCWV